ncbi:MAG: cytochrome c biogenesis CcdA family protein [Actinobacteria bacterium]|nr:cytochrome c biogenesis CcdA family protein [Actinomycetota bacterium]
MTGLIAAAFAAGMVATVNPCGFAMLPAYLGFILGDRGSTRGSALVVGASVSAGFVAVFVVSGVLIASGLRAIVSWIPWMALVVGVGLVIAGVASLRGRYLFARLPGVKRSTRDRSIKGLLGFGASYGLASLSCTLPIFLSLIAGTVATGSVAESALVFMAYGLGMSLVVIVLTLIVAAGRDRLVGAIRPLSARLNTISGWVMIIAGIFIVWYWATVLIGGAADLGTNPMIRFVENLAADIANLVAANRVQVGAGALVVGVVIWFVSHRSTKPTEAESDHQTRLGRSRR